MKIANRIIGISMVFVLAGSLYAMAPQVRRRLNREIKTEIENIEAASLDENIDLKVEATLKKINRLATPYKREADRFREKLNNVLAQRGRRAAAIPAPVPAPPTEQERITQRLDNLLQLDISQREMGPGQFERWTRETRDLVNQLSEINERLGQRYGDLRREKMLRQAQQG